MFKVLIPRERRPFEARVAATPETTRRMRKEGLAVYIEEGAGQSACFSDDAYREAGAVIVPEAEAPYPEVDVVLRVGAPTEEEAGRLRPESLLIGLLSPYRYPGVVRALCARRVTSLAMELIPRISRAQSMDALSSQASVAGYKAVLLAAGHLPRYFPLLMTAAGTVQPARVVVLGAGVAGLQAVATARRLGAVVEVSDIRAAVKQEVESLGARFIEVPSKERGEGEGGYARQVSQEFLQKQRAIVAERISASDAVITTALVPGKPAPRLVPAEVVEKMRPGAVIVDLAVEQGGNCTLSVPGETVVRHGVTIIGHPNLPSTVPSDASALYSRNVLALLLHLAPKGVLALDLSEEITAGALLTHRGEVINAPVADFLQREGRP